jgi:hypothetical protein
MENGLAGSYPETEVFWGDVLLSISRNERMRGRKCSINKNPTSCNTDWVFFDFNDEIGYINFLSDPNFWWYLILIYNSPSNIGENRSQHQPGNLCSGQPGL